MENKRLEIESILKDLYYSVNVEKAFLSPKTVYSYLIRRSVSKKDLDKKINFLSFSRYDVDYNADIESNFFGKWINDFRNKKNIEVFCSKNWKYFCQFRNGNLIDNNSDDFVKVYVPLDYDHIYEGAKSIFTFLADFNIKHESKISSNIRFDDIVIRLTNLNDARRLQSFIDNNSYIQEGLIKPNPFAFSKNGVSYAFDGGLSYNFFIAALISDYVLNVSNAAGKNINDVSLNSFYSYVDYISNDVNRIKEILEFKYGDEADNLDNLLDAYFVIDLLKKSLVSNNLNDYERAYLDFCNLDKKREINNLVSGNMQRGKTELLDEYILVMMKKYPLGGDPSYPNASGIDYIFSYLDGNKRAITRDNNLRERVSSELSVQDIYDIVSSSGVLGNTIDEKVNNYIKMVMLNEIISCMFTRMGNDAISNINEFMKTGDSRYITNKVGNARKLTYTLRENDMRAFLANLGLRDIEEYINKYYINSNNNGRSVKL